MSFELRCAIDADLGLLRDLIRVHGRHNGLDGERLEDLVLAVNEAVTNVFDHGGRAGTLTMRSTGDRVIVAVCDVAGRLTHEHLAAARLEWAGPRGYGLWVIQHLCDEVTLEQTLLGSLLSLHMRRRPGTRLAAGHEVVQDERARRDDGDGS